MQERLQKVLARAGVASRRKAEELILEGRVEIDGRTVTELGTKVDPAREMIRVDGTLIADIAEPIYYVLFKPASCVTTLHDPQGRASLADHVQRLPERVFPVGRLDYDAEGAVILTNDGGLAHRLMHPRFGARRTYLAKVKGHVQPAAIEKLRSGVMLDDGFAKPVSADLVSRALRNTWIKLVLTEGRTHLVKRLCEAVGHPVQRLYRSDYAGISVEGMMPGELRELSAVEVRILQGGGGWEHGSSLPPRRDARRKGTRPVRSTGKPSPTPDLVDSTPSAAMAGEAAFPQEPSPRRPSFGAKRPASRQFRPGPPSRFGAPARPAAAGPAAGRPKATRSATTGASSPARKGGWPGTRDAYPGKGGGPRQGSKPFNRSGKVRSGGSMRPERQSTSRSKGGRTRGPGGRRG